MRAIPAQRFLASHAKVCQLTFVEMLEPGATVEMPAIVAYSPVVLLPAVIATARVLALHLFESDAMLAIDPPRGGSGYLGVCVNLGPIDSTPEGLLRALLLKRASDILFRVHAKADASRICVSDLLTAYQTEKGQRILLGQALEEVDFAYLEDAPSFESPVGLLKFGEG